MKKNKITLGFLLTFIIFSAPISAQILFNEIYEKPFWNYGDAVIERSDGNYLLVGGSRTPSNSTFYINALLIDNEGNLIWDKYYGSNDITHGNSVIETDDSNILILGRQLSNPADPYLTKTDFDGNVIWERSYSTPNTANVYAIGETLDNKYYFLSSDTGTTHLFVTDTNGDTLWSQSYSGDFHAVIETLDGGFALVGRIEEFSSDYNVILQKVDNTGNPTWTKTFGDEGWDDAFTLVQFSDGSYLIAGEYDDPDIIDEFPYTYLIKTDSNGNTLWVKTPPMGRGHHLRILAAEDGLILSTILNTGSINQMGIRKLDLEGELIWGRVFSPGFMNGFGNNVAETSDEGFIITGSTNNSGNPPSDIRLIKLDKDGNFVLSTEDFLTNENRLTVYPNPTSTRINFELNSLNSLSTLNEVTISNIMGQQLIHIKAWDKTSLELNVSELSRGIYLYQVITKEAQIITGKFLKQ